MLSWEPRTTADPRRIMNPTGVPSPERPRDHESPPDGTTLRSGNGMRVVWPANPKGASPRLGTLGLHAGTALRSKDVQKPKKRSFGGFQKVSSKR